MTASDYVPTYPDLLLASEGASTDAIFEHNLEVSGAAPHLPDRFRSQSVKNCRSAELSRRLLLKAIALPSWGCRTPRTWHCALVKELFKVAGIFC